MLTAVFDPHIYESFLNKKGLHYKLLSVLPLLARNVHCFLPKKIAGILLPTQQAPWRLVPAVFGNCTAISVVS
jgi:hypothetical protein